MQTSVEEPREDLTRARTPAPRAVKRERKRPLNVDINQRAEAFLQAIVESGRATHKTDATNRAISVYYQLTQLPLEAQVVVKYRDGREALIMLV